MKIRKICISLLLVLALCASYLTLLSGANGSLTAESSVISAELQAVMAAASATEKIPVSIWTEEISSEAVEAFALDKTGLNRDKIREMVANGEEASLTSEAIDEYIAAEREIYKRLQTSAHQAIAKEYAFLQTAMEDDGAYVCSYAPMIIVELTTSQIQTLSIDEEISSFEYAPEFMTQNCMGTSVSVVENDYIRLEHELDGDGVKIGMWELALPDINNSEYICFNASNIHLLNDQSPVEDIDDLVNIEHATVVASIMCSVGHAVASYSHVGMAPRAELYCASGNFLSGIESLVEAGVNVINMSAAVHKDLDGDNVVTLSELLYGQYGFFEKWIDHIALNHSVHFVVAAGNTSDESWSVFPIAYRKVTHPAMAYNVISVGALEDNNTSLLTDDVLATYSSYVEEVAQPNKPDLVAPGSTIVTAAIPIGGFCDGGEISGTSFAAPHVTGIIAQLLEERPSLKVLQDTMKAILTAGISHPVHHYASDDDNFDKFGAGVVNAKAAEYVIRYGRYRTSSFSASSVTPEPKTYTFTVSDSDEIVRVSLAWLKYNKFSTEEHTETPDVIEPLTNLNLTVITPNNVRLTVPAGESVNNNLEIIELDPDVYGTGTYTIEVSVVGNVDAKTYFSVAWW